MTAVLRPMLGLVVAIGLLVARAQAQEPRQLDFSNQGLINAALTAKEIVDSMEQTGETFVVPADYFLSQFQKEFTVVVKNSAGEIQVDEQTRMPIKASLPLTGTDKKLVVCVLAAEAMLAAAGPDDLSTSEYLAAWEARQKEFLDLQIDEEPLLDLNQKQAWQQFLDEWREMVLQTDSTRIRDALRQAAYSIVRVGLDIEQEHIDRVLRGLTTPSGERDDRGLTLTTGVVTSGTYYGPYSHATVFHERRMGHIYRHHERRMYKIQRIRSRY